MKIQTIFLLIIIAFLISATGCTTKQKESKIVVLTFDDAVRSQRTFVAPLLKKKGFGATFFITHAWMQDTVHFMNWQEIAEIYKMGFEIGNHSWSHIPFDSKEAVRKMDRDLYKIDSALIANGIPKPVSFAYPGNHYCPATIKKLKDLGYRFARRGMQPEIPYGKIAFGPLFDPEKNNRLVIPTTADAYPEWSLDYFKSIIDRAQPGKAIILQFHGVPDIAHPWVNTDPGKFKLFMDYLEKTKCKVIALKDLDKYFKIGDVDDPALNYTYTAKEGMKYFYRDIYPDTWVATDALGRTMPDYSAVGPVKKDQRRVVGIFYITWHTADRADLERPFHADVSKILKKHPEARMDGNNPAWYAPGYFWGEPEMGYFLSQDEYVIRKDMSMLADAGVDVLVLDVTNAVRYWKEWDVLFRVMEKMKDEGNKVPDFMFWAYNGPVITVVQELYDSIYKRERYKDLWFYWDGKPLLLYNSSPFHDANRDSIKHPNPHYDPDAKTNKNNPHYGDPDYTREYYQDYTKEVKNFFTLRNMWWGYYKWLGKRYVGTEDNWSFGYDLNDDSVKAMNPDELVSLHNGIKEEAAGTPAQHASSLVGKSWTRKNGEPELNEYDLPVYAYVPWLGKTVKHPEGYGIYFQQRWNEALKSDPPFIYLNDWNEWVAGKYPAKKGETFPFMRRKSNFFFVDQYNAEFNRCLQPMKDGYTDNYYMQMAQNIRRYKGVRPIPQLTGMHHITIDGNFSDWDKVKMEYRDTKGDTFHRDHKGYGGLIYKNNSGRNDILTSKIVVDSENIYFYVATSGKLTSHTGKNWMLLLIDADQDHNTGWYGYDFLINKKVKNGKTTTLMAYEPDPTGGHWVEQAELNYRYEGNALELAIPRKILHLQNDSFVFDFKWSDDPADLIDPISLCVNGDTAPNRRFNYRCIWKENTNY